MASTFNKIKTEFMNIYEDSYLKSITKTIYHLHHRDSRIECEYKDLKNNIVNKMIHVYKTQPMNTQNTMVKTYGEIPRNTSISTINSMKETLKNNVKHLTEQQIFDLNFIIHCVSRGIRINTN